MALDIRFSKIRESLAGSALTISESREGISRDRCFSLSSRSIEYMTTNSSSISAIDTEVKWKSESLDSILVSSIMSETILSICSERRTMLLRYELRCSSVKLSCALRRSSAYPLIAVIGVLKSWDTLLKTFLRATSPSRSLLFVRTRSRLISEMNMVFSLT